MRSFATLLLLSHGSALHLGPAFAIREGTVYRSRALTACDDSLCDAETMWCQSDSGIKYVDEVVGEGELVAIPQLVKVAYSGELVSTGKAVEVFGAKSPAIVFMGKTEPWPVWEEMLEGMRVGGKRRIVIPPSANLNIIWGVPDDAPEDREAIRFEFEIVEVVEGLQAIVPKVKSNFVGVANAIGISPYQLFIGLTFLPYLLPDELRPGIWQSGSGGNFFDSFFNGVSKGPEANLDAQLFEEPIQMLDKSLYR